jgi:hypothetical protein
VRLLAVVLALGSCGAVQAHATEGEWHASAGLVGAQSGRGPAVGLDGALQRDWSDFWGIGLGVRAVRSLVASADDALLPRADVQATVDVRCTIDALQWIPFVQLGAGGATDFAAYDGAVRLEAGLGWRPKREAGWEVRAGYWVGVHQYAGIVVSRVIYGGKGAGLDL